MRGDLPAVVQGRADPGIGANAQSGFTGTIRPGRPGTRLRTRVRYPACSSRSATSRAAVWLRNPSHVRTGSGLGSSAISFSSTCPAAAVRGTSLADHDRGVGPQADQAGQHQLGQQRAGQPGAQRTRRQQRPAASGHRAPAGTNHQPPARCRSAPHPADPGTRGRPGPQARRSCTACPALVEDSPRCGNRDQQPPRGQAATLRHRHCPRGPSPARRRTGLRGPRRGSRRARWPPRYGLGCVLAHYDLHYLRSGRAEGMVHPASRGAGKQR